MPAAGASGDGWTGALLVDQANLEAVEVGALELLLELVEGVLDLVLEAVIIVVVVGLGPVAVAVAVGVGVGLMGMRHGQGGGGADQLQLRKGAGDVRAKGKKGGREAEQRRGGGARTICRSSVGCWTRRAPLSGIE